MEVICLESEALYQLIEDVASRLIEKQSQPEEKWVDTETAMSILKITSKTTLQQLRDNGKIRFSHPKKRIILYDRSSLLEYLEDNAKNTF